MLEISRKTAVAQKLTRYFTGKPCVAGHIADRYTSSGACSECMALRAGDAREGVRLPRRVADAAETAAILATRSAVAIALAGLVEVRLRAFPGDFPVLRDTAAALCCARSPVLREAVRLDALGRPADGAAGTYLYRLRVPAEDVALIRDTANALLNAHSVDTAAVRGAVLGEALRLVDATIEPLPDWTERP